MRHARRILQERAAAGEIDEAARERLGEIADRHIRCRRASLRAMWALHVTGGLAGRVVAASCCRSRTNTFAGGPFNSRSIATSRNLRQLLPQIGGNGEDRSVAGRAACIWPPPLQRLPRRANGGTFCEALTQHAEDAGDHNLPLMYWYAAEPLAEADPEASTGVRPVVRQDDAAGARVHAAADREHRTRRNRLAALVDALDKSADADEQLAILQGIRNGLEGRRRVEPPAEWAAVYGKLMASATKPVQTEATALGVTFGDAAAMDAMRKRVASAAADADVRRAALEALLAAKDPQLVADAAAAARRSGAARRGARGPGIVRRSADAGADAGRVSAAVAGREAGRRWPRSRRGPRTASRCLKAIAERTDRRRPICRPTWCGSCTILHERRRSTSCWRRSGARSAARRPTKRS